MLHDEDEQASNIGIFPQLTLIALFEDALLGSATTLSSTNLPTNVEHVWFDLWGDISYDAPSHNQTNSFKSNDFQETFVVNMQIDEIAEDEEKEAAAAAVTAAEEELFFWHWEIDDQLAQDMLNPPYLGENNLIEQVGGSLLSNQISTANAEINDCRWRRRSRSRSSAAEPSGGHLLAVEPVIKETFNKKWNAMRREIRFSIANSTVNNFFDANDTINNLFVQIFVNYIEPIAEDKLVQYIIEHDTLNMIYQLNLVT
jgi:hypothetical protein